LISSIPDVEKKKLFNVTESEAHLKKLRGLSSTFDDCSRLKTQSLPNLRQKRTALETDRARLQTKCDDVHFSQIIRLLMKLTILRWN
jgi:hypothetical protein